MSQENKISPISKKLKRPYSDLVALGQDISYLETFPLPPTPPHTVTPSEEFLISTGRSAIQQLKKSDSPETKQHVIYMLAVAALQAQNAKLDPKIARHALLSGLSSI